MSIRRRLCRILAVAVCVFLVVNIAYGGRRERRRQSSFRTADRPGFGSQRDRNKISSSLFVRMLNEKLRGKYQDIEIIINSCHSGEFIEAASDPNHGLQGEWSIMTAAEHGRTAGVTSQDTAQAEGIDGDNHDGLETDEGFYHGFKPQVIKAIKDEGNGITNEEIFRRARDRNHREFRGQNPRYAASSEDANNMTIHGGRRSNHAIMFSQPASEGQVLAPEMYEALKAAGYSDDDIEFLYGDADGDPPPVDPHVDGPALKANLEAALDALAEKLALHEGNEKALIWIDAHGRYEYADVAYQDEEPTGQANGGETSSGPTHDSDIPVDPNMRKDLEEETWSESDEAYLRDDPMLQKTAEPEIFFATSHEDFKGQDQPIISVFANKILVGTVELENSSSGAEYFLPIDDRAMVRLLGTLGNDSNLRITLDWGDSAGTIRFGTPEDIWYNPDYTNGYYGVGIAVEMDSYMEAAEADLNYDGIVNFGDFAVMADYWLMFTSNPMADIVPFPYGDSFVDMFDLQILAEQWLAPSP